MPVSDSSVPARDRVDRAITPATASAAAADTTGFRSSGQSPGAVATVHLVGGGALATAVLRQIGALPAVVVAVSDDTATVFDRRGVPLTTLCEHLQRGGGLAALPRAERLPPDQATAFVAADVVIDVSEPANGRAIDAAVERGRAVLRRGASLVIADAGIAAAGAIEWQLGLHAARAWLDGALGGIGRRLADEIAELRERSSALALVGERTSTAAVQAIESGAVTPPFAAELRSVSTFAARFAALWAGVFGTPWLRPPTSPEVDTTRLVLPPPHEQRARAARGATTRLVARGSRGGRDFQLGFEEVAVGTALAAPADRVVATYELPQGRRVHTGTAIGSEAVAAAVVADAQRALTRAEVLA